MNGKTYINLLLLMVPFIFMTTSSAVSTIKSVDAAQGVTPSPQDSTTTTTTSSMPSPNAKSKSEPKSKESSKNTTAKKPLPDRHVIASIPTFDFSVVDKASEPEVVNTCNTKDMCMQGLCIKGTCKMKKCSTDVVCVCDPGFTGQFCDKNITQVEMKNGKNGNTNGKTNGKINGNTNNKTETTTKELVNGKIDQTLLKKDGEISNTNTDSGVQIHGKRSANENENSIGNNVSGGETGKDKGSKDIGQTIRQATKPIKGTPGKGMQASVSDTKQDKGLPKGSYVKGPEVYVSTDSSSIMSESTQKKIGIGDPTFVKEKSNKVTVSTLAVEKTRVGIVPEMLASDVRSRLKPNDKTKPDKTLGTKDNANFEKKVNAKKLQPKQANGKMRKLSKTTTSKQTIKEKLHMPDPPPKHSNINVVSTVDIVDDTHIVAEEKGVVSIPNNTVGVGPLFANSEIKITIETSKLDKVQASNVEENTRNTSHNKVQEVSNSKNVGGTDGRNASTSDSSNGSNLNGNNGLKKNMGTKQKLTETKSKRDRKLASTKTLKKGPSKKLEGTSASQKTESRKNMQSELLNPLIQLMNIIGSDEFVEKVSAVKIEIITKKNTTESKNTVPKETNAPQHNTLDNTKISETTTASKSMEKGKSNTKISDSQSKG